MSEPPLRLLAGILVLITVSLLWAVLSGATIVVVAINKGLDFLDDMADGIDD